MKTVSQGGRAADQVRTSASWFNVCAFGIPSGAFGNLGRNVYRGAGVFNTDFSLFKAFPIKEQMSLQFRFEAFNIFNIQNYDAPSTLTINTTQPKPGEDAPGTGLRRARLRALCLVSGRSGAPY